MQHETRRQLCEVNGLICGAVRTPVVRRARADLARDALEQVGIALSTDDDSPLPAAPRCLQPLQHTIAALVNSLNAEPRFRLGYLQDAKILMANTIKAYDSDVAHGAIAS